MFEWYLNDISELCSDHIIYIQTEDGKNTIFIYVLNIMSLVVFIIEIHNNNIMEKININSKYFKI